jgi:hypothetical protein
MKNFAYIVLALTFSCGLSGEIALQPNKSATVDLEIQIFPEMTAYLTDLGELTTESLSPFDAERTLERLRLLATVNNPSVIQDNPNSLRLRFSVLQIENFLLEATGEAPSTYIQFTASGSTETIKILLTKENFLSLLQGFQEEVPPSAEIFLPTPEAPLTSEEYRDLMTYVLEPYASDMDNLLSMAKVDLKLSLPGNISTVNEGSFSGKTWNVSLPLDRVLSLYEPVELTATYRK